MDRERRYLFLVALGLLALLLDLRLHLADALLGLLELACDPLLLVGLQMELLFDGGYFGLEIGNECLGAAFGQLLQLAYLVAQFSVLLL